MEGLKIPIFVKAIFIFFLLLLPAIKNISAAPTADYLEPNSSLNDSATDISIFGSNFDPATKAALYGGGLFKAGSFSTKTPVRDLFHSGNYVYLLASPDFNERPIQSTLHIVDVSNPANPTLAGSCKTPGGAQDIYVSGHFAYIVSNDLNQEDGNEDAGLQVVNLLDPANPTIVGSLDMDEPLFVYVSGTNAYVSLDDRYDAPGGLQIVDISDPANPLLISTYSPLSANGIYISGNYAYVCNDFHGLLILDISDPQNLITKGSCDTSGRAYNLTVSGNYAFVANLNSGVSVINIADPANPINVSKFPDVWQARDIYVNSNSAFVADGTEGLKMIDISDPTNPIFIARFDQSYLPWVDDVSASGSYVYLACSELGLQIIDTSNTSDPSVIGECRPGGGRSVYVSGNYAYVGDLQVIDVSEPSNPIVVGSSNKSGSCEDIYVSANYAYIANSYSWDEQYPDPNYQGFKVYDITDPTNPIVVGAYGTGDAYGVWVSDIYAYVSTRSGFKVLDISQPENLSIVGACDVPDSINHVYVRCGYAYVSGSSGLIVIDVRYPRYPTIVGLCDTSGKIRDVDLSGNYAYVVGDSGLKVIDISTNPFVVGSYSTSDSAFSVSVSGDYAYVADIYLGLLVIDISDPVNPTLVGSSGSYDIWDIFVYGNYVYGVYNGFKVFRKFEPLTFISYISDRQIDATVPAGFPAGTYNLHITNPNGERTILHKAFTAISGGDTGEEDSGSADENVDEEFDCSSYEYVYDEDENEPDGGNSGFMSCFIRMLTLE